MMKTPIGLLPEREQSAARDQGIIHTAGFYRESAASACSACDGKHTPFTAIQPLRRITTQLPAWPRQQTLAGPQVVKRRY
jgi:hypothetical protein